MPQKIKNSDQIAELSSASGKARYQRASLTAGINLAAHLVQIFTVLVSVRLILEYVGVERFGMWMVLSMALSFIAFSDFGVGIGLQDRMTKCLGEENFSKARQVFASSLLFAFFLSLALMVIGVLGLRWSDLPRLLDLKSEEAIRDVNPTAIAVILTFGVGLVAGVVQRAFNALQEGYWAALILLVARTLGLLLLVLAISVESGLPTLVFIIAGFGSLAMVVFGLPLFVFRHRWVMAARTDSPVGINISILQDVLRIGILGLGASLAIYLTNNAAVMIIAARHGASEAADYAAMAKLLAMPPLLLFYMLFPLWPAITEANTLKQYDWIRNAYRKCLFITVGLTTISVLIILPFGREIILLWTGQPKVVPSFGLLLAGVLFMSLGMWSTLTAVLMNGLSKFRIQATVGLALAVLFTIFAIMIPSSAPKESIVWVIAFGYLLRCLWMQFYIQRVTKRHSIC